MTAFICYVFGIIAIILLLLAYSVGSTILGLLGIFILMPVIACASFHLVEYIKNKDKSE